MYSTTLIYNPLSGEITEMTLDAVEDLRTALRDLLNEVVAAGFLSVEDYGWPRCIKQAQDALAKADAQERSPAQEGKTVEDLGPAETLERVLYYWDIPENARRRIKEWIAAARENSRRKERERWEAWVERLIDNSDKVPGLYGLMYRFPPPIGKEAVLPKFSGT